MAKYLDQTGLSYFWGKIKSTIDAKIEAKINSQLCYSGLRNKNLGTSITTKQLEAIKKGDFSDLWNGDYWVINGVTWRIVDNTDYFYNRGTAALSDHGIVVMPDDVILGGTGSGSWMNDTNSTSGGYAGTKYRSTYRSQCKTMFANAFGASHIATHRELITNVVADGKASGNIWTDADVEVPTEENIHGAAIFSSSTISQGGSGYNTGLNASQFRLFQLNPKLIRSSNRTGYWCRNVADGVNFARVGGDGTPGYDRANFPYIGFRPYATIKG